MLYPRRKWPPARARAKFLLQGRAAEPHRDFVGAVLCSRFAYLINVARVASSDTDEVLIGPGVGHCSDHY